MAETSPSLDPQLLDRNLDVLQRRQPDVAAQLFAARAQMTEALPAATRDGWVSFRIREASDRQTWFGRTSIPRVRAAALLEVFQPGEANVILPGIAEGSETELLLQRLGPHRAVFVWEEDPVNLLLAMRLHEFTPAIENERLVLVLAAESDLANALAQTLRNMPGHLCPERLLVWPWQTQSGMSACKSAVEAAYREIERERHAQLAEFQSRLAALPARPTDRSPTAALFSIHANEETWAWADALTDAASAVGWQMQSVILRTPADVHPLARAGRLARGLDHTPDFALLLDVCRADIADVLPVDVSAISWFSHEPAASDTPLRDRLGSDDRVVVTSGILAERLAAAGVDSGQTTVLPLPSLVTCEAPADWADRPIDVAVVASLAPTDPQSHGFTLSSHMGIWNAALDLIRSSLDDFTVTKLSNVLDRVESKARVRMDDPKVRNEMIAALGGPVATSLIWRNLTHALADTEFAVTCRGYGWPESPGLNVVREVPAPAGRLQLYRQAKCVVFVSPTGLVPPDVLLAAEAGAAVVWRSHPRDTAPGGLATLLCPGSEALSFPRNQALVPTLRRLLPDRIVWRELVTAARRRCRTDHTASAALARLQAVATSFVSNH